ncbi:hypothetical protein Ae717Ps2_6462c [Pseudonocardia sp. Ae717_Ps2]|uniref:hypothetical protein n=1 Tax=Pseudonocardia sp. Ae717_Ps2 TaxID=1885573 RepID=UPI00094B4280|nr:hypothetical protein [Pseudonocardia sp. Ae717_Ps2]OLM28403.1 hypothetical protein Ae717Ps2_6462c [Pseudonocardia sp. Ae717_Ps2]
MNTDMIGSDRWVTQPPEPGPPPPEPGFWERALGIAADPSGAVSTAISEYVKAGVVGVLESVWAAGLAMLRDTLALVDHLTRFDLVAIFSPGSGLGQVWPALWWLAILVATCVFFSQIVAVVVRGGWGVSRLLLGPLHFGIALAFILSLSAGLVAAADGIARGLLDLGLGSPEFARVLDPPPADPGAPVDAPVTGVGAVFVDNPDLGTGLTEMSRAIIMAVAGALGSVAAVGFAFEMVVRQAIIVVLIAVSPIAAAGLLSGATSAWWWRSVRWLAAAILLEPALALVLVIGVGMLASASGVSGLLAGAAVLLAAVFCPWAVYKLLAFVDPATGAGMDVRAITARRPAPAGAARPGAVAVEEAHAVRFADTARAQTRAGGSAAAAGVRAGRSVGGVLAAGYHGVAAVGEYAAGRLNQQAGQTGVGHGGGFVLNRTPSLRPPPAPAPSRAAPAAGDDPPPAVPPAPAPARTTERDGVATRDRAGDPPPAPRSLTGQDTTTRDQQQRQGEQRGRVPRPAPETDRRPPKPPPSSAAPNTAPPSTAPPRPRPGRET